MKHLKKLATAAASATLLLDLSACGDGPTSDAQSEHPANDADGDFATVMIAHHAHSMEMGKWST